MSVTKSDLDKCQTNINNDLTNGGYVAYGSEHYDVTINCLENLRREAAAIMDFVNEGPDKHYCNVKCSLCADIIRANNALFNSNTHTNIRIALGSVYYLYFNGTRNLVLDKIMENELKLYMNRSIPIRFRQSADGKSFDFEPANDFCPTNPGLISHFKSRQHECQPEVIQPCEHNIKQVSMIVSALSSYLERNHINIDIEYPAVRGDAILKRELERVEKKTTEVLSLHGHDKKRANYKLSCNTWTFRINERNVAMYKQTIRVSFCSFMLTC